MFGLENLNSWHLLVLALLGIFIFGPDRLPKAIADGVRMLRNVRNMARNATSDLSRQLEEIYRDVKNDVTGIGSEARGVADDLKSAALTPAPAPSPNGRRHTFDD